MTTPKVICEEAKRCGKVTCKCACPHRRGGKRRAAILCYKPVPVEEAKNEK